MNKRSTILGTPHYMAPEILDVMEGPMGVEYGSEVSGSRALLTQGNMRAVTE